MSECDGKVSFTQHDTTDSAIGCRNHSFIQDRYRRKLEVPARVLRNCSLRCSIVDASTVARPRQGNDYGHALDVSVEEDLAALMKEMHAADGIDAYIDADSAEPIECAQDVIERVGPDADQDGDNDSEAEARYNL
ncbi:uncharacterized protein PHALS_13076 [Plasmopara halstedii]|uniref:Uncharacterized protein n=1 Tax=Plasmopara halstedii TaxID=4781 RepID=A0A0P1ANQ6_PLAHL|nr:uncharacterized protein PHALS_13076 [Plasmopara halstedii]CEG42834.1 hypothetical protein PHALS_13076 [Plasmopara halstedii]|eukprot:XP_024579203.1 hypothetical protein PHALS_13076 [Plasmopara halstedii]